MLVVRLVTLDDAFDLVPEDEGCVNRHTMHLQCLSGRKPCSYETTRRLATHHEQATSWVECVFRLLIRPAGTDAVSCGRLQATAGVVLTSSVRAGGVDQYASITSRILSQRSRLSPGGVGGGGLRHTLAPWYVSCNPLCVAATRFSRKALTELVSPQSSRESLVMYP